MAGLDLKKYKAAKPVRQLKRDRKSNSEKGSSTIRVGKKNLSDKSKESVYAELAVLLSAGIDIKSALDLLVSQQTKLNVRSALGDVRDRVVSGHCVSDALQREGCFSAYEYHSVRIGEETGSLPVVLSDLAAYYKRKIKQQRQLVQALAYPVIVLLTAVGAVTFMLSFIVPMFSDVFRRFGGELPYLTRVIIGLSAFMREYFMLIGGGLTITCILLWAMKGSLWYRRLSGQLLLRLPVVGPVVRGVHLARLCSSMALLTSSRVPLVQAIALVRNMITFYPIQSTLEEVEARLMQGASLHESLSRFPVYDQRLITILRVGEETGKLDDFFTRLALQYNEEVEHRSAVLGSALEPIIIIFLGAVVGLVLMAMYLPLFELGTSLQ